MSTYLQGSQSAARVIEEDGYEGFRKAEEIVETERAFDLLVGYLRRYFSSKSGWPGDPEIDLKVNSFLSEKCPDLYQVFGQDLLLFYSDEGYCLDNFSAFAVELRGRVYPTVEHAYQASQFITANDVFMEDVADSSPIAELIRVAPSAHEAKKLGNSPYYQKYIREDWGDEIKLAVMEEILRAKYAQHDYVQRVLGRSSGRVIIENSPTDAFWGRGPDWKGLNHQGRIWMKIRDGK